MENLDFTKDVFIPALGVIHAQDFSKLYPIVNNWIYNHEEWQESRDGKVKEMLNVKTMIENPYRRLSGGYCRNENVFFLLAEAMWIFTGHKDVRFLTFFNKKMADFSDDGKVFHAPYGFRLRHWGVRTEDKFVEENMHAAQGYDQVADAIKIFAANPNTRQVVMTIWNPDFDLGTKTKDIPCNDMVMLKIRDGKLVTTIQNRSNDLHWGLPTNIFQFSFVTEMIAACLGIELGTQTHNSQSLHIYEWNNIAPKMDAEYDRLGMGYSLYDFVEEKKIDFNFTHDIAGNRLREIDYFLNLIIGNLTEVARGKSDNGDEIKALQEFSTYLWYAYQYLKIYLEYKAELASISGNEEYEVKSAKIKAAVAALAKIEVVSDKEYVEGWDVYTMALNFFAAKIPNYSSKNNHIGKL